MWECRWDDGMDVGVSMGVGWPDARCQMPRMPGMSDARDVRCPCAGCVGCVRDSEVQTRSGIPKTENTDTDTRLGKIEAIEAIEAWIS
jgi:hypothetical protein